MTIALLFFLGKILKLSSDIFLEVALNHSMDDYF